MHSGWVTGACLSVSAVLWCLSLGPRILGALLPPPLSHLIATWGGFKETSPRRKSWNGGFQHKGYSQLALVFRSLGDPQSSGPEPRLTRCHSDLGLMSSCPQAGEASLEWVGGTVRPQNTPDLLERTHWGLPLNEWSTEGSGSFRQPPQSP